VGDCGIPEGALLIDFAEAILVGDEARRARRSWRRMGAAAIVDAAGIACLFNAIDRVADATGAPLEDAKPPTPQACATPSASTNLTPSVRASNSILRYRRWTGVHISGSTTYPNVRFLVDPIICALGSNLGDGSSAS
jgi:hypothetical protein